MRTVTDCWIVPGRRSTLDGSGSGDQRGVALVETRFRILGPTQWKVGGRFDDHGMQPKPRGMLTVLLLNAGKWVPVDDLIDWMWSEDDPSPKQPRGTLHTYAKRIRGALQFMGRPPMLHSKGGAYRFDVDPELVDYHAFRALHHEARSAAARRDHRRTCELMKAAFELWQDRPLADLATARAHRWRRTVEEELWLPAHGLLFGAQLALGQYDEVLEGITDLPPERQDGLRLVELRLEAMHRLRRHDDAVEYFLRQHKRFRTELDQPAADELRRFHEGLTRGRVAASGDDLQWPAPRLLPHDIADLTGREVLLKELDAAALDGDGQPRAMILALEGTAGVGKTALAVHWAHRMADRFPDGMLYVDLSGFAKSPLVEPSEVVDRFLAALEFPAELVATAAGRANRLRRLLDGRRMLVLLDNAKNSEHVERLFPLFSTCLVVVTSRQRLATLSSRHGARGFAVDRLTHEQSQHWLTHRIGRGSTHDPTALGALTRLCGGLPLALNLVADRARSKPGLRLTQLVDSLKERSALLDMGDEGGGQDTRLRAVFETSYEALGVAEQRLFRLLGLHPGPDASLTAVSALTGSPARRTSLALERLFDAHLVEQSDSPDRYRMHNLIADYAAELVEDDAERLVATRRMVSFYVHTAHHADRAVFPQNDGVPVPPVSDGVEPLDFVDDESAMSWCMRERSIITAVALLAEELDLHEHAAALPLASGQILKRYGCYDDVLTGLAVAVRATRASGDVEMSAHVQANLGYCYLDLHEYDKAEENFHRAYETLVQIGRRDRADVVLYNMAELHIRRREHSTAVTLCQQALELARSNGDEAMEARVLHRLGEARRRQGRHDEALSYLNQALMLWGKIDHSAGAGLTLTELGCLYQDRGDAFGAMGYCHQAATVHQRNHDLVPQGQTYIVLAAVHRDTKDFDAAMSYAEQAVELCRRGKDRQQEAAALDVLARLRKDAGAPQEARELWERALELYRDLGNPLAAGVAADLNELGEPIVPEARDSAVRPLSPEEAGLSTGHFGPPQSLGDQHD
ncbi:tetratricopeptide repeat protein [Solihabitans fulvus]|uniref:Tetratricopeptide repeat protein n=1 Tax=Solihabitans fulvus TaxID=1892852 RepID=A0A5B2X001_9PSEU|nr:tetratricopeptide repeat protein [Solihabitans fulvus]KAA2256089.1 tetratricopeptide repeat protein [Solihabitans fulvus]